MTPGGLRLRTRPAGTRRGLLGEDGWELFEGLKLTRRRSDHSEPHFKQPIAQLSPLPAGARKSASVWAGPGRS